MARQADTTWLDRFMGYASAVNPGDPGKLTDDLANVKFNLGRVYGRGGLGKYQNIDTVSSASIIGLHSYRLVSGTHQIVRMLPTAVEVLSGGVWTDITGVALTGSDLTRPQHTIIDDTLILTNEGADRPRKYTGTGNTAVIAGGLAPFCKGVISYLGYLFAFNVSDDGSFADVVDGHRIGRFSDDWDNIWDACTGYEITLDETPGAWVTGGVVANAIFAIKSDGVVKVKWVGGNVKFRQDGVPCDVGSNSPLSFAVVGNPATLGFYLGTDGIIYTIDGSGVHSISDKTAPDLLQDAMLLDRLPYARGVVDSEANTYYLFYDDEGYSGSQRARAYISFNYQTKEWSKGRLGQPIIALESHKPTDGSPEVLLVSTDALVEEFDGTAVDDDGYAIPEGRYLTTGWQKLQQEGWVHGVRLVMGRSNHAKVAVSIALGLGQQFEYEQPFSLAGESVNERFVEILYRLPSPQLTDWINIKIRMLHTGTQASTILYKIGVEGKSVLPISEKIPRSSDT